MSARDQLATYIGYESGESDPRFEQLLDAVIAERDAQIVAWLRKKASEYGISNRENRAKTDAIVTMASKLSRGAVRYEATR